MSLLRYERVSDPDSSTVVDHLSVYNPEQIDDTATIVNRSLEFDSNCNDTIAFRDLFLDPRLSPKQQRICSAIVLSTICIILLILISLFAGFGKVIFDVLANEEMIRHGLSMVPNLRTRPLNIFYLSMNNKSANVEYVSEIKNYLEKYRDDQDSLRKYLRDCSLADRSTDRKWCSFDVDREFSDDCSARDNFGYNVGSPCILFAFDNRLNWTPNFRSNTTHLPFACRMQYQYSTNVFANLSYYPSLPSSSRNGGFLLNMIPTRKVDDRTVKPTGARSANEATVYSLPPLLMVKLRFPSVTSKSSSIGPFTLDCRIKENVEGFEFDNLGHFKGQTAISFDFVSR